MNPSLSEALAERGYDTLTPVQTAVSDPDLVGEDLLVSAQTGSGKTVGFGLAMAPTLLGEATAFDAAGAPLALVVAPTRELAFQVMRELRWLYARTGARVASCVGGMDMRDERRALERGAHIVVGTPGRLKDHIMRGSLDMGSLSAIILDEADEMLDLGFREDLEFMLGEAPENRRTLMFSATVPPMIAKLAAQFQRNAKRINTRGEAKQHADISYQAVRVAQQDQENAIFNLLRFHDAASAIVFANTRAAVNHLMARLSNRGFSVVALSGELTQSERTNALQAMRDGRARVCVATDVAARGIDLPNLNLVIHADLPTNTESLLHRSGRTGRAGRKGISAMIVPARATKKAERLLGWAKIKADWVEAPSADEIRALDEDRLLADPLWEEPLSDGEAAFAEKLLSHQSPEVIAAAYLRLYRAGRSAPEELLPPDTKPERKERQSFGPSTWFSLSVGRDDRAEPRWILPLLCRAGGLDKSAIGAIRTQASETFVEVSTPSVDGFLKALGTDAVLEDGIRVTQLDTPPNLSDNRKTPRKPGPSGDAAYKARKPRHSDKSDTRKPKATRSDAPAAEAPMTPVSTPVPAHDPDAAPARKPRKPKSEKRARDADAGDKRSDKHPPAKGKSWGDADRPRGKSFGKPGGKPGGKPSGKPGGKPAGKPAFKERDRSDAKPKGPKSDARDASKRFVPPGKAKPGARKPRHSGQGRPGGDQPPRRRKP
ncbi:DEAD/DEAH box helicase [Tropicimonas sp. S265A]|uniref:DEAD/DEAH box helicase n=1 Tax=Tropicimonas sp. S265A TaxID=3415134 RepID=UPI003C7C254A